MADTNHRMTTSDHSSQASTIRLLYCGASAPFVFWVTTFVCGFLLGDYNHLHQMVSALGTIGKSSQFLFTAGLVVCSTLSVLFIFGLKRICQRTMLSTIPVWLILSYSFSIAGAGLFPLPLRLHLILGMPSILLILSPLAALLLWPKTGFLSHLKAAACISITIMALGFLAFLPAILGPFLGLKQRFFHLGWGIWFVYLSIIFIGTAKGHQRERTSVHA